MQTIVVGYDGSEPADRALGRATELIDGGGTVVLVSAIHMLAGKGGMGFDPIEKETYDQQLDAAKAAWPRAESRQRPSRASVIRPGSSPSRPRRRRRPDSGRKRAQEPARAAALRLGQRRRRPPGRLRRVGRRPMNADFPLHRSVGSDRGARGVSPRALRRRRRRRRASKPSGRLTRCRATGGSLTVVTALDIAVTAHAGWAATRPPPGSGPRRSRR